MKKNQGGFSIVEVLLVFLAMGIIGAVGWYVYDSQTSNDPSVSTQSGQPGAQNTMDSLVKYEDDFVSFDHPSDWKIEQQYGSPASQEGYLLNISAPIDKSLQDSVTGLSNVYFGSTIGINKSAGSGRACLADCTVYHVDKISPKSPEITGSLVISDWLSQGYPQLFTYTQSDVAVGQKTYNVTGLTLNSNYSAQISGWYMVGDSGGVKLASDTDFQNSVSYIQFKNLVNSLSFKVSRLP